MTLASGGVAWRLPRVDRTTNGDPTGGVPPGGDSLLTQLKTGRKFGFAGEDMGELLVPKVGILPDGSGGSEEAPGCSSTGAIKEEIARKVPEDG